MQAVALLISAEGSTVYQTAVTRLLYNYYYRRTHESSTISLLHIAQLTAKQLAVIDVEPADLIAGIRPENMNQLVSKTDSIMLERCVFISSSLFLHCTTLHFFLLYFWRSGGVLSISSWSVRVVPSYLFVVSCIFVGVAILICMRVSLSGLSCVALRAERAVCAGERVRTSPRFDIPIYLMLSSFLCFYVLMYIFAFWSLYCIVDLPPI